MASLLGREESFLTGQSGGSPKEASSSAFSVFTTLAPTTITSILVLSIFLYVRPKSRWLYMPRTFLDVLSDDEKTPAPSQNGIFSWFPSFWSIPDDFVLKHHSLEAYLFLRFFRMIALMCIVGCVITWPILFPVNIMGGGKQSQLDILSIGNVAIPRLYFAHALVACVYFSFVIFTITRETIFFINLRQAYLITPWYSSKLSSRTVLFTSVPEEYLEESRLRNIFQSVRRIWIGRNCSELRKAVDKQNKAAVDLELNQIAQSRKATQMTKQNTNPSFSVIEHVTSKSRPTMRQRPAIGKKLDAIDHYRNLLEHAIPGVENKQHSHDDGHSKPTGAVFIEFKTLAAAQSAYQETAYRTPMKLAPKSVGSPPESIIWGNLDMTEVQREARLLTGTSLMTTVTIFWSIPVAIIGSLSNIDSLTTKVPFLRFIEDLPPSIIGAITGLLPTILLSTVISLIPLLFRYLAKQSGEVTQAGIEKRVQTWYFVFQVVQVFLVTTVSSGAAAVVSSIVEDPKNTPKLLAENLPKASNFYMSFFIINGLGQSSFYLLRISSILFSEVVGRFFDNTPRKLFDRYTTMEDLKWGSLYPKFTNLAVIALVYSCIAPLTLGFASIGVCLLYLTFKYNIVYVVQTKVDTQGQLYAKAMNQLLTGVYLAEFCLIGLFGSGSTGTKDSSVSKTGPTLIMSLFTVATIVYHISMQSALGPLTSTLPADLLSEAEEDNAARTEEGDATEDSPLIGRGQSSNNVAIQATNRFAWLFLKFFNPQKYDSYGNFQQLLSTSPILGREVPPYSEDDISKAYMDPAVTDSPPRLWIVRDNLGLSTQEVRNTARVVPVTDQGANFDRDGKIVWNKENLRSAPLWKEPIHY